MEGIGERGERRAFFFFFHYFFAAVLVVPNARFAPRLRRAWPRGGRKWGEGIQSWRRRWRRGRGSLLHSSIPFSFFLLPFGFGALLSSTLSHFRADFFLPPSRIQWAFEEVHLGLPFPQWILVLPRYCLIVVQPSGSLFFAFSEEANYLSFANLGILFGKKVLF